MFSKFNNTQCGRTCACAVVSLCAHNSISNVVASVTIHDDTYLQIYLKEGLPSRDGSADKAPPGPSLGGSPHGKSASLASHCHFVLKASSASAVSYLIGRCLRLDLAASSLRSGR